MALSDTPAERHREVAAHFATIVDGVTDWSAPTPVAEWRARDVVDHLITWFPGFLSSGAGIDLPMLQGDPATVWRARAAAIQALLDDPDASSRLLLNPHIGEVPLPDAIDRFYTADVFMHSWDLARATGQDDRLDADFCAAMVAGMEPVADMLAASGQYGPRVLVPDDADAQTRMLGLIGRDPDWQPPG